MNKFVMDLLNAGGPRLHAFMAWLAGITLSLCCIMITTAIVCSHKSLSVELGTLVAALSGLAGYSYKTGQTAKED